MKYNFLFQKINKIFSFYPRLKNKIYTIWMFNNEKVICHHSVEIKCPENIQYGKNLIIGPRCTLGAAGGIYFGDNVRISAEVLIETGGLNFQDKPPYKHILKAIKIGSDVWIGARAIILGGITVGDGAVIGAGSVVTKNVPDNAVIAGNPAQILYYRNISKELPITDIKNTDPVQIKTEPLI